MKWYVATPFSERTEDPWLGRFVPPGRHQFESVPAPYRHDRSRPQTGLAGWFDYVQHGLQARQLTLDQPGPAGLIVCFPQLPLVIGLRQRASRRTLPLIAWAFNLGHLPGGIRRWASQAAFSQVSRFVVHSRAEVLACSEWLQLPQSRFQFVPLQRAVITPVAREPSGEPYVIAMGSAGRDYRLLFSVLTELGYPAVVVAGRHALEGLTVPSNVTVRSDLTIAQCHELLQGARLSVTPIANQATASGQVTLIDAMMFSKAQIVTTSPGSVDYLDHGSEALMVRAGDHSDMAQAIRRLWEDGALRERLGRNGRARMVREFSDEAVGLQLGSILDEFEPVR